MKYKRIIFISLLLSLISLMCLFVFAEKEVLPVLTWDKTYGGSGDDTKSGIGPTEEVIMMRHGPSSRLPTAAMP
jgi:hypothetical protein